MTEYRTDPKTGAKYAFGGLIGNRTIDDRRSERDRFERMLIRRSAELHRRGLSPIQHLALEEDIWGFDSMLRRRLGSRSQRGVWAETMGLTACPDCGRLNDTDALLCDQCGADVTSTAASDTNGGRAKRSGPRREQPAVSVERALRGRGQVEATQTFNARDPVTGKIVPVRKDRTRVGDRSWLYKMYPSRFQYVA